MLKVSDATVIVDLMSAPSVLNADRSLSRVLQMDTQVSKLHRAVLIGVTSTRKEPAATLPLSATSEGVACYHGDVRGNSKVQRMDLTGSNFNRTLLVLH